MLLDFAHFLSPIFNIVHIPLLNPKMNTPPSKNPTPLVINSDWSLIMK